MNPTQLPTDAPEMDGTRLAPDRWLLSLHDGDDIREVSPTARQDKQLELEQCGPGFNELAHKLWRAAKVD